MTRQEKHYYTALRKLWNEPAGRALRLAKDYARAQDIGLVFEWQPEQDNPRDVFGDPSYYECDNCGTVTYSKGNGACCDEPRVKYSDEGVYYDPTSEHYCLVVRTPDHTAGGGRETLASLGMIDGAHNYTDYRGYWFMVECELAGEALAEYDRMIADGAFETEETEETLA